jgi:hypothetical protein
LLIVCSASVKDMQGDAVHATPLRVLSAGHCETAEATPQAC